MSTEPASFIASTVSTISSKSIPLEEKTTIKKDTQKRIITKLEKLGIISTVKRGLPVKRCAKINENVLKKFL